MTDIVVGYDATEESEPALRAALHEAARSGTELKVVTVWRTSPYAGSVMGGFGAEIIPPVEGISEHLSQMANQGVERAKQETGLSDVRVTVDVGPWDPGTRLVSSSSTAELLVMGRRHHGGFVSALVGSATNYVLHHAQCPVLVVGRDAQPTWSHVVVGVDGSDCSLAALRWAARRARASDCPLLVVHAWELLTAPGLIDVTIPDPETYGKQVESWLDEIVTETLGNHGLQVEVRSVRDQAAAGLLAAAGPADLLVLGSHGRGGFTDLVLGSVSLACVHHARSSVAVLRSGTGPTQ